MIRDRGVDGPAGTPGNEIPRSGQTSPTDPRDVGGCSPEGVVFVSEAVKDADHRAKARDPVTRDPFRRSFCWNGERITEPFVHSMTDQPAADTGIDHVTPRGNPFQRDRSRLETSMPPMRRIVFGFDEGNLIRDAPIRLGIAMPLVDAGSRLETPAGEQSILAIESPATDDQPVDRFLNPFDFSAA